jgi:hypothetical protein
MAKELHDDVYDAALDKIATCTHLNFCSTQPANYAGIAAVTLANVTLTAGDGNGDYVVSNGDTSGRKVRVAAQTGMTPTGNGTVTYAVLDDGTTLLAATTVTSQAVTTAQTWNSPAFDIELTDPT